MNIGRFRTGILFLEVPWRHFTEESPGWIMSYSSAGGTGAGDPVQTSHKSFCSALSALEVYATWLEKLIACPDALRITILVPAFCFYIWENTICQASSCSELPEDLHNLDSVVCLCCVYISAAFIECLASLCTLYQAQCHTWTRHLAVKGWILNETFIFKHFCS